MILSDFFNSHSLINQNFSKMKKIILTALLCLTPVLAFGQLIITGPDGNVLIGDTTDTPIEKLEVDGNAKVKGKVFLNSGVAENVIAGETNSRRMTVATSGTTISSSSFFQMFGNETQTGGILNRKGEFNLVGNNIIIRSGKGVGNYGSVVMRLKSNKDVQFYTSNTFKQGNSNWTVFSDRRLKKDIRDYDLGLKEILEIRPVFYTYNGKALTDDSREFVGVIAQEYQEIAPADVTEVSITDEYKDLNETYLGVNDAAIKYMLVNAVQEQQEIINEQSKALKNQQQDIDALKAEMERLKGMLNNEKRNSSVGDVVNPNKASLEQNTPNPFSKETNIQYFIPEQSKRASIKVYNLAGFEIQSFSIDSFGNGTMTLDLSTFQAGMYVYALLVDGHLIDSKKMILE